MLNKKQIIGVLILLVFFVLLASANLIWKLSMGGEFGDMGSGMQTNIIASIILVVIGIPSAIALLIKIRKMPSKQTSASIVE